MKRLSFCVALCAGATMLGCTSGGGGETDAVAEWQSETSTEGDLTTIKTISGSVWGGAARLEETLSIGVESGDDAYMLGSVRSVWEDEGEIFVLDAQVPAVRVYDASGRHLRDLGAKGAGPGEFDRPDSLIIDNGRVYVRDTGNGRIMILDKQGKEVGVIRIATSFSSSRQMVMTHSGLLYSLELLNDLEALWSVTDWRVGMVPQFEDPDAEGEPIEAPDYGFEEWTVSASNEGSMTSSNVPFAPQVAWTLSPSGASIGGVSDEYAFDIEYPDGRITRVEKSWQPIPVEPEEADWNKRRTIASMRRLEPEWTWDGHDVPANKPPFTSLEADHSGRIWVSRPGPGTHVDFECTEEPEPGEQVEACWQQSTTWEIFDEEGRFLGAADRPEGVRGVAYVRDDLVLVSFMDDFGTIMVKRYRIVLPGA